MKKIFYAIFTTIILFLTSCEMIEEITINEDGSGNLYYNYNMSKLLESFPEGSNSKKEEKIIDSTFVFKELLENPKYKDSLAKMTDEDRKVLETLKDMTMTIKVNEKEKKMIMGFGWEFENIDEIPDIFEKIKQAQRLGQTNKQSNPLENSAFFKGMNGENQDISYSFDGVNFTRNVKLKKDLSENEIKEIDEMLGQDPKMKDIFGEMKYTIKLNFPRAIKKINNKDAVFSNKRRSVSIKYNMSDFLKNPKKLNLKIRLKK